MSSAKAVGEIKFFDEAKGYGFLVDQRGNDRLFHDRDLITQKTLEPGDQVIYIPYQTERGHRAKRIKLATDTGELRYFGIRVKTLLVVSIVSLIVLASIAGVMVLQPEEITNSAENIR